jgi:hypothetical protein
MKIQINKAPPVVQPPDTFVLTGTMEELSAIKTFANYYYISCCEADRAASAALRLANSITQVGVYAWSSASKLFLPE